MSDPASNILLRHHAVVMLTPTELKSLLKAHGLRLTKQLGQHHLVNARTIQRIVDGCQLSTSDTVVEIGAGLGALTEPLSHRAGRVVAVEVDRGIYSLLFERLSRLNNVTVLCRDVLTLSLEDLKDAVVVGAIPYHVTSQILVWLSEHRQAIRSSVLIIQEEVARRLLASPGTKAYGRLSLLAAYCWDIRTLFPIARSAFFPQPDVDSTCIRLLPRPRPPVAVANERLLFSLVKAAFSQRRKTLVNCLSETPALGLGRREAETAVRAIGLPANVRGEILSLEQFAALADQVAQTTSIR